MGNQEVPSPLDLMPYTIHRLKDTVAVNEREDIAQNMPLRMAAGRFLYIAAVRLVPSLPKSLTDPLALLTGYQHSHSNNPIFLYSSWKSTLTTISCVTS